MYISIIWEGNERLSEIASKWWYGGGNYSFVYRNYDGSDIKIDFLFQRQALSHAIICREQIICETNKQQENVPTAFCQFFFSSFAVTTWLWSGNAHCNRHSMFFRTSSRCLGWSIVISMTVWTKGVQLMLLALRASGPKTTCKNILIFLYFANIF